jgi:hypothetical protein
MGPGWKALMHDKDMKRPIAYALAGVLFAGAHSASATILKYRCGQYVVRLEGGRPGGPTHFSLDIRPAIEPMGHFGDIHFNGKASGN